MRTLQLLSCAVVVAESTVVERKESRDDYVPSNAIITDEMHEMIFAVKQTNLDKLEQTLMDVSLPQSPARGQYLTWDQAQSMTQNEAGSKKVQQWLKDAGVNIVDVHPYGHYIKAQ